MKTLNSFSASAVRNLLSIATLVIMLINFTSCEVDEPASLSRAGDESQAVKVTYTYHVPEEILRHVEVRACFNNDDQSDMLPAQTMMDNTFSHTYNVSKFPMETIFVAEFINPHSTANYVEIDTNISMDITVSRIIGGEVTEEYYHEDYPLKGNLANALREMVKDRRNQTYAVKVYKDGTWSFRH